HGGVSLTCFTRPNGRTAGIGAYHMPDRLVSQDGAEKSEPPHAEAGDLRLGALCTLDDVFPSESPGCHTATVRDDPPDGHEKVARPCATRASLTGTVDVLHSVLHPGRWRSELVIGAVRLR